MIENYNDILAGLAIYGISPRLKVNNPALYAKIIISQKKILGQKEMYLRKVQNNQGKGGAYSTGDEDYI